MVGVRQSYAKSTAESELIKQYEFMHRIFRNARRRHRRRPTTTPTSGSILKILGDSALEEHAQWILIHRERSIDEKEGAEARLRRTTEAEFKYRAFISYSHADEEWAKWLHKALETYRVPKRLVGRETEFGPVPDAHRAGVPRPRRTRHGDEPRRHPDARAAAVGLPARDLLAASRRSRAGSTKRSRRSSGSAASTASSR